MTWKYVPARLTDVAATFRRIRREQEAAKQQTRQVVRPLRKDAKP